MSPRESSQHLFLLREGPLAPPSSNLLIPFSNERDCRYIVRRDDEPFVSYRTSSYKLHFFEVPSGFKFVLLSDPSTDSLKFVLRQLYTGAFQDYVVRNPLVVMDSRVSGKGIDSDAFRAAVNTLVTSLSIHE